MRFGIGDRARRGGPGDGALAALLISPRDFYYAVCHSRECAGRRLYYTYTGEECPFCGERVGPMVAGTLPQPRPPEGRRPAARA
jgi:hypothetical protein